MSITGTVKTMQEQNAIFAEKEPNYFKRVHMMANDIKKRTNERLEMEHIDFSPRLKAGDSYPGT